MTHGKTPSREPCPTGYICRDPRSGAGCGSWYAADPDGTDAWWFRCSCGELAGPALASEVGAAQLELEVG